LKHELIVDVALGSSEIIGIVAYRMNVSAIVCAKRNFLLDDIVRGAINVVCVLKKINIANGFYNSVF
jgi:hypothetical protein